MSVICGLQSEKKKKTEEWHTYNIYCINNAFRFFFYTFNLYESKLTLLVNYVYEFKVILPYI